MNTIEPIETIVIPTGTDITVDGASKKLAAPLTIGRSCVSVIQINTGSGKPLYLHSAEAFDLWKRLRLALA